MALFGKLFEKKECSICGGEIGLLGNRKLEDGNMCKDCASKLSPWFSDRRSSTVEQIKEQLAYREANQQKLASFKVTRTIGRDMKLMVDENAQQFVVTRASNLATANPDIIDFDMVTGVDIDIDEDRDEDKYKNKEGKNVSYNPPRYFYSYDFNVKIYVNHPYFDDISFRLNSSSVKTNPDRAVIALSKPNPLANRDYQEYENMGLEIQNILDPRNRVTKPAETITTTAPEIIETAPIGTEVTCQFCGAKTTRTADGICEYCGGKLEG